MFTEEPGFGCLLRPQKTWPYWACRKNGRLLTRKAQVTPSHRLLGFHEGPCVQGSYFFGWGALLFPRPFKCQPPRCSPQEQWASDEATGSPLTLLFPETGSLWFARLPEKGLALPTI